MTMGMSNNSPLDDAKIWEALELAQGKTLLKNKEGQLKAEVAQAGSNFRWPEATFGYCACTCP